jgi:RNA polymerase sigma-70 factor (ECF subfamily)
MNDKDSTVRGLTEEETIRRAQTGEREALVRLFGKHMPTVHRFALRMCRDEDRARDVAQESMLTALKSLEGFRLDASFSTWLFTIARSHCGKTRRKADREPVHAEADGALETLASAEPPPDAQVAHSQVSDAVERGLDALEPAEREVVLLRDVEGLSAREAADILGISVPALKSRLHRARSVLREHVRAAVEREGAGEVPEGSCPDVVRALSEKLEGDLPDSACAVLESHLSQCPACAARCESVRRMLGACANLRERPASPEAMRAVEEIVASIQRRPGV